MVDGANAYGLIGSTATLTLARQPLVQLCTAAAGRHRLVLSCLCPSPTLRRFRTCWDLRHSMRSGCSVCTRFSAPAGCNQARTGPGRPGPLFPCVVITAQEMERHVRFIAHDPAIVARGPRRNIEDCPGSQFVHRAILHRRRRAARKYHSDVLHIATRCAHRWPDVNGPPPSRLIGRTADGHAS